MGRISRGHFRFRKHDNVGAAGAEQDGEFLSECFYDSGDLRVLSDCGDYRRIVLGRTGAGKTALLLKLKETEEHSVLLNPEHLSLQYLSNSNILRYLDELGVNLDLFYRLLWRHILAVELIKARFPNNSELEKKTLLQRFLDTVRRNKPKQKTEEYFDEWGKSFWKDTEVRVREVTKKFEDQVEDKIGAKASILSLSRSDRHKASQQERAEIVQKAQQVVNAVQIGELAKIIDQLAEEFLSQPQPRCYLIIDRLDENWVDDSVRYRLIRALIETIKDFASIKSAKIVIALRRDLLERVIRFTRDAGFQEEKHEFLYLNIQWSGKQLQDLADKRVNQLVRMQYTKQQVAWKDLLPSEIDHQPVEKYILERTMYRPRDIIQFFNCCIEQAVGSPEITAKKLRDAEAEYSGKRYRFLGDEWFADYPELLDIAKTLKGRPSTMKVDAMDLGGFRDLCLEIAMDRAGNKGQLTEWATDVVNDKMSPSQFRQRLLSVFYQVGLVGLKLDASQPTYWSFLGRPVIRSMDIRDDCTVAICPVFYRFLGVNPHS